MQSRGVAATFLGPIESLRYFTGLVWQPSERLLGALVTEDRLTYIVPGFERSRVESLPHLPGDILSWEEDESSAALVAGLISPSGILALDDAIELSFYHAFAGQMGAARLVDGGGMLNALRMIKSPAEIAPIQYAMNITLEIQRKVRDMIAPGIAGSEVSRFIDQQHRAWRRQWIDLQDRVVRICHLPATWRRWRADPFCGRRHPRRYRLPHRRLSLRPDARIHARRRQGRVRARLGHRAQGSAGGV
ncbi:hypothetical protein FHT76_006853 [Rhizobium sp. BK176]|nr:hypothetical protein [Rhizobium sp. BK661]MCS4095143.1 hypothetical protein [Rhizobium sp. BK176]